MDVKIYKATNIINKKIYIGRTKRPLEVRRNRHFKLNKRSIFSHAIRKHGLENFHWEILERGIASWELSGEREKHYIREFNSLSPNGYNLTDGGEFGLMTPEILAKMGKQISERQKGQTKENCERVRNSIETRKKNGKLKGLNKENCERVRKQAEWQSIRSKGLNKDNCPRLAKMGQTVKMIQTGKTKYTCPRLAKVSVTMAKIFKGKNASNCEWQAKAKETKRRPVHQILNGLIVKTWRGREEIIMDGKFSWKYVYRAAKNNKIHRGFSWTFANKGEGF